MSDQQKTHEAAERSPDGYVHHHDDGQKFWEARIHGPIDRADACWKVDRLSSDLYCTPVWFSTTPTEPLEVL